MLTSFNWEFFCQKELNKRIVILKLINNKKKLAAKACKSSDPKNGLTKKRIIIKKYPDRVDWKDDKIGNPKKLFLLLSLLSKKLII